MITHLTQEAQPEHRSQPAPAPENLTVKEPAPTSIISLGS